MNYNVKAALLSLASYLIIYIIIRICIGSKYPELEYFFGYWIGTIQQIIFWVYIIKKCYEPRESR